MSEPSSHRRGRRGPLAGRRWAPVLALVAALAVAAGVWSVLPDRTAPLPAASVTTDGSTTSATPGSTTATTAAPTTSTTETTAPTTEPAPTTTEVTTAAPPAPATTPEPEPAPAPAAAPAAGDPGQEGAVLDLVNQERAAAGCGPVVGDAGLAGVARAHSADMRDRGYFSHTTPEGLSPWDRAAAAGVSGASAENIAQGYGDAASVMAGWMDSPGHRANILDCGNTRLGVGMVDSGTGPFWTQLFGR